MSHVSRLIFASLTLSLSFRAALANDFVLVKQSNQTGKVSWYVGKYEIIAGNRPAILVANDPQTGARQIGLTHMGYTGTEARGRSATLLLSIDLRSIPVIDGSDKLTVSDPREYTLDVELPADRTEERRLRKEASLPMKAMAGSINVIQLRWDNVPGRLLFNWLSKPDGLRITAQAKVHVELMIEDQRNLDVRLFDAWWALHFGSGTDQASWTGGTDALALEALNAGVYSENISPPPVRSFLGASTEDVSKCISKRARVTSTGESISRVDLLGCFPPLALSTRLSAGIQWHSDAPISGSLSDSEIIDSTNGKAGLAALLDDGS